MFAGTADSRQSSRKERRAGSDQQTAGTANPKATSPEETILERELSGSPVRQPIIRDFSGMALHLRVWGVL